MNEQYLTRVLVALDCGHPSSEALQQLTRLLGQERLELTGLYIEDEDLIRAAGLPGLLEISPSGEVFELDSSRLREDMAVDLVRIRRAFEDIAGALRLQHRFEVARGRVAEVLCAAAMQSDFVLVCRAVRASGLRPRTGLQFGPLLHQPKRILFVNEPWTSGSAVIVLGGDPEGIAAGTRIAQAEALRLIVALPGTAAPPQQLPAGATVMRLADWSEDAIADLCLYRDARLLILPADAALDAASLLTRLMDRLPCSVLKLA